MSFELSQVPTFADPVRRRAGFRKQNPFRIVALALDRALGDFAAALCYAASVKAQFDHAKLLVYYRNDRPYKSALIDTCPGIDEIIEMREADSLPLDVLDGGAHPVFELPAHWRHHDTAWHRSSLVLIPSMARYHHIGQFEQTARFRFASKFDEVGRAALIERGVDPERWFCVLHHREPSYGPRGPQPLRDADPSVFDSLISWIIGELGGQVVRIGHPQMTSFEARRGFVDLAPLGDSDFKLQLYAVYRARFMLAVASGPGICGSCFGTPTAMVNNPTTHGVWNAQDVAMYSHILAPDGRRITRDVAVEREMYFVAALNHLVDLGYQVLPQSLEELKRLASLMHDRTADTQAWRSDWYQTHETEAKPNTFSLSRDPVQRETIVEFEDLAPGEGTIVFARQTPRPNPS